MLEPTSDEKRNGWTSESLTEYMDDHHSEEQETARHEYRQHGPLRPDGQLRNTWPRQTKTVSKHNPLRRF